MAVEQLKATLAPKKVRSGLIPVMLAGCAAILVLAELGARAASSFSQIERRTTAEIAQAERMRGGAADGIRRVLVVGNSLLLEGVDFPALQRGLRPEIEARRVVVEQTAYLDWYYGLRKLFESGARPDLVVLTLDSSQLLGNGFRGDYSASRLIAAQDLMRVAGDADLSATEATSLCFAHYSRFYGTRVEIRKWLLWTLMPQLLDLRPYLAQRRPSPPTAEAILQRTPPRLEALRALAAGYNVRVKLLAPASLNGDGQAAALAESGQRAGVEVLNPISAKSFSASDFSDGFHLNPGGAQKYTAALVSELKRATLH